MSHAPGYPILLQHAYTEAEWAADNPVLMKRETGWTTDTRRVKLGDGVTAWNDLPWAADEAADVAAEQARAEAAEGNLQTAIDDEALLARDADNLESGTVDDARLTPRLSGLAGLGLSDGQLLQYDALTDLLIPANPTGDSELAVAENITGVGTQLTANGTAGTIVAVPFTAISITDSQGRPVTLEYFGTAVQTVAGQGTVFLVLYETTTSPTIIGFTSGALPNSAAVALQQVSVGVHQKRVGVVSTTRTFELRAYIYAAAANNPSAYIANGVNTPTILRAVAG